MFIFATSRRGGGSASGSPAPKAPDVHLAAIQMEYEYNTAALQAELERYQVENGRLKEAAESFEGQAAALASDLEEVRGVLVREQSALGELRAGSQQEQTSLKREWGRSQQEAQALKLKLKVALKRLREEEFGAKKVGSELRREQERTSEVSTECQTLRGELRAARESALQSQEEAARVVRSLAESESRLLRARSDADEARASHVRLLSDVNANRMPAPCPSCPQDSSRSKSRRRRRRRSRDEGGSGSTLTAERCLQELGLRAVLSAWGLERDRGGASFMGPGNVREGAAPRQSVNVGRPGPEHKDASTATEAPEEAWDSRSGFSAALAEAPPQPDKPLISPRAPTGAPPTGLGRRLARVVATPSEPESPGSCASSSSPAAQPASPEPLAKDGGRGRTEPKVQPGGGCREVARDVGSPRWPSHASSSCTGAAGLAALAESAAAQLEEARSAWNNLEEGGSVLSSPRAPGGRPSPVKSLPQALAAAASRLEEDMRQLGF